MAGNLQTELTSCAFNHKQVPLMLTPSTIIEVVRFIIFITAGQKYEVHLPFSPHGMTPPSEKLSKAPSFSFYLSNF